jgi:deoxyribose-phosphate aldolase
LAVLSPDEILEIINRARDRLRIGLSEREEVDLAGFIDHTLLGPTATTTQIDLLCAEAARYGFFAVCVNPVWVARAARSLKGTAVRVASVVGFPLGATLPEVRAEEAALDIRDGATEVDMVIEIGALKGGDHELVRRDIAAVSERCAQLLDASTR